MSATPIRILLAEDEIINQKMALHILKSLGCEGKAVDNGLAVIEAVRNGCYDLILMDMQMPEMDGIEAAQKLREQGCSIPIVALSANTSKDALDEVLKAGMNDFIQKPITRDKLAPIIQRYGPDDAPQWPATP
ncbi:MAG: response regulator [Kiritimatiellae bacterium]|nr:response regulator [Kiritimatiellia bacterium]